MTIKDRGKLDEKLRNISQLCRELSIILWLQPTHSSIIYTFLKVIALHQQTDQLTTGNFQQRMEIMIYMAGTVLICIKVDGGITCVIVPTRMASIYKEKQMYMQLV
jgi:hypothetical protein